MNIIQTLSAPVSSKSLFEDAFGWFAPEYHLMSWALSSIQLRSFYPGLALYADSASARVLVDELKLPYTEVKTLAEARRVHHPNLWALPKIETYARQQAPFLHVDGDVFVFSAFPDELMSQGLIAQNMETGTEYYASMQRQMMEQDLYLPACVREDFTSGNPLSAVNAGILGGNDTDFLQEYAAASIDYVVQNEHKLKAIDVNKFNVFFEQHLFHSLATSRGKEINYYFDHSFEDNKYKGLGNFWEAPRSKTYLHLIGGYKRNQYYCTQMAFKLRETDPDLYYRIIHLAKKKGVRLKLDYYHSVEQPSQEGFRNFSRQGLETYATGTAAAQGGREWKPEDNWRYLQMKSHAEKFLDGSSHVCLDAQRIPVNTEALAGDMQEFHESLRNALREFSCYSDQYLYGKDLHSTAWYARVFLEPGFGGRLVKCSEVSVIESKYDWNTCFQSALSDGNEGTSEEVCFLSDRYYSLVVAEAFDGHFSLNDVDDFQLLLLSELEQPLHLAELIEKMKVHFEDDVLEESAAKVEQFILMMLQQLLLVKAIRPVE
jgi:hypothetical protein